jgi:hypothetical protein
MADYAIARAGGWPRPICGEHGVALIILCDCLNLFPIADLPALQALAAAHDILEAAAA